MQVWAVSDDSAALSGEPIAIFAHPPTPAELDSLGPLRQDFSEELNASGRPNTVRHVECWDVRE